ncbi:hypothetical protein Hte_010578 [Hypoxylon texense]
MPSTNSDDDADWRPSWYDVTLEQIIPYRGFIYRRGHKIFDEEKHWVLVKMALQVFAPSLELQKVDIALASLVKDATRIAAEYRATHPLEIFEEPGYISTIPIDAIFEEARKQSVWAIDVPEGLIPHLMHKLIRARSLYIKFSHLRGTPEHHLNQQPWHLATAIDEWLRDKPVKEADEEYTRKPAEILHYMMERMLEGKGADWDALESDNDDDHSDYEDQHTIMTRDDIGVVDVDGPDKNLEKDSDVNAGTEEGSCTEPAEDRTIYDKMLQAISNKHDAHHERRRKNSLASLTTSLRDNKTHLLLAASGSVATIKLPLIIEKLAADYRRLHPAPAAGADDPEEDGGGGLSIRVVLTPSASRFLAGQSREQPPVSSLLGMDCVDGVYVDADEWKEPWKRGDAILHIELRRWAHLLAIAPLSANTMAKIANGMADGLLTSVVRAWDAWGDLDADVAGIVAGGARHRLVGGAERARARKRVVVAPAMNTAMWRHPITARQLAVLEGEWGVHGGGGGGKKRAVGNVEEVDSQRDAGDGDGDGDGDVGKQVEERKEEGDGWFEVLRPKSKALACGDVGDGAMMEWSEIVAIIEERLGFSE